MCKLNSITVLITCYHEAAASVEEINHKRYVKTTVENYFFVVSKNAMAFFVFCFVEKALKGPQN